jgi:hypothetical protein
VVRNRVKRFALKKFLAITIILLFIASYFPQVEKPAAATQSLNGWKAQPMYIIQNFESLNQPSGYSPGQIKTAYGLPDTGGAGTTIAIIDAYDTPNIWNDLGNFSAQFNLPLPSSSNFEVHKMQSTMSTDNGWAMETCLDVEWAHAIAPEAKILLVEAVDNQDGLLSAVDYARSRPDVVAVSMSWGGAEFSSQLFFNNHFSSSYGAVFFASSGDTGSTVDSIAGVNWPASSPNVVGVGGTSLNLTPTGTVISETSWSGSGGGTSIYEQKPIYQTSYGLSGSERSVPDISYNADPSTGIAVYYGGWHKVGGTSAGAPQWAAIHSLGLSATNTNLYSKAKSAYSSYFRDISSGPSNGAYDAGSGYDKVTGLGSPLTYDFSSKLTVDPTSGPANGTITLSGTGFTVGSSVNISYQNLASAWVPLTNNYPTTSKDFTYYLRAPDLLQNNPANDSQAFSNDIVFKAVDNSNGNSYSTIVPYTEMRRGLIQIDNQTAATSHLYGNSTDLSKTVFVSNGQSMSIVGKWFSPGTVSLLWDNTQSLGTASVDSTGLFNATVQVPPTTAGQHTLSINDGASSFTVNVTRLPTISYDYGAGWHTTDFTINVIPDYSGINTYYRINNGALSSVFANGQPTITTESNNNTLEYWSTWNIYGSGSKEVSHVTLTDIQLDKTAPAGSLQINNGESSTSSSTVALTVAATDSVSGISQMRFSNNNNAWSIWESYANSRNWPLTSGDGLKMVYCQVKDIAGSTTMLSASITVSTPPPPPTPTPTTIPTSIPTSTPIPIPTSTPTPTPTAEPTLSPTTDPTETPTPTPDPTATPTPTSNSIPTADGSQPLAAPEVPESTIQMILVLLSIVTLSFIVKYRSKRQKEN